MGGMLVSPLLPSNDTYSLPLMMKNNNHSTVGFNELIERLKKSASFEYAVQKNTELPNIHDVRVKSGALLNVFYPLVKEAYSQLKEKVRILFDEVLDNENLTNVNDICECYYQDLVAKLAMLSGRTLVLELQVAKMCGQLKGESSEARFQSFVDSLHDEAIRLQLLNEYPVLFDLVTTVVERWRDFGLRVFQHLHKDWQNIERTFFEGKAIAGIKEIKVGAGDTHKQGASVVILTFSKGQKLVYKPRSLAVEVHFNELLGWCNTRLKQTHMKQLKVLDKGEYGWVEYVTHQPCLSSEDLLAFYYRQGALLALMYALEGNDFHYENLIACGEHPVIVDLETLFHPYLEHIDNDYRFSPTFPIKQTVLRTGLLPRRMWTENEGEGVDLSAMGDMEKQVTPDKVLTIKNAGTDEMAFVREHVLIEPSNNRPSLNHQPAKSWKYSEQVLQGFEDIYRMLMAHRESLLASGGPVRRFADNEVRVILRETRIYASYLSESLHPDLMRSNDERKAFFDNLTGALNNQPYLKCVIAFEREELGTLDIPFFTTKPNSKDLWTSQGTRLPDFFHTSALERIDALFMQLSEADLYRQKWLIRESLYACELSEKKSVKPRYELNEVMDYITPKELVKESEQIAKRIEQLAFSGDKGANWFIWKPIPPKYWEVESMSTTMYDGLVGIVLYLAYLGDVSQNTAYRALSEKALVSAREMWEKQPENIEDIGMFSGWAGIIYTLTHLGHLWQQPALLDEAVSLCQQVQKHLNQDEFYDVIGGAAGTVVVLLNLYQLKPEKSVLELAVRCGRHILHHAVNTPHGLAWHLKIAGDTPLAGMSHGGAGIALALSKLAEVTQDNRFQDAANQAVLHENTHYSEKQNNWPDLREGNRPEGADIDEGGQCFLTAWCHGAPGIGLARMAMHQGQITPLIEQDINRALHATQSHGYHDNHSLCHGVLGNLELLLQMGLKYGRDDLLDEVQTVTSQVIAAKEKTGWKTGLMFNLETPGFMVGLSGIGFQLLRIAYPNRVPSVLSMQGPLLEHSPMEKKSLSGSAIG